MVAIYIGIRNERGIFIFVFLVWHATDLDSSKELECPMIFTVLDAMKSCASYLQPWINLGAEHVEFTEDDLLEYITNNNDP